MKMTQQEFNEWLDHHTAVFPGVANFIERLLDAKTLLIAWRSAMSRIELRDAMEATARILDGTENPPGWRGEDKPVGTYDSDIEQTPAVICRIARRIARDRNAEERRRPAVVVKVELCGPGFSMAKTYRRFRHRLGEGMSMEDAKSMMDAELEEELAEFNEQKPIDP